MALTGGWLGQEQLKVLTFFTSFLLCACHGITVACVQERVLVSRDDDSLHTSRRSATMKSIGEIWTTLRTLPRPIQQVLNVQVSHYPALMTARLTMLPSSQVGSDGSPSSSSRRRGSQKSTRRRTGARRTSLLHRWRFGTSQPAREPTRCSTIRSFRSRPPSSFPPSSRRRRDPTLESSARTYDQDHLPLVRPSTTRCRAGSQDCDREFHSRGSRCPCCGPSRMERSPFSSCRPTLRPPSLGRPSSSRALDSHGESQTGHPSQS